MGDTDFHLIEGKTLIPGDAANFVDGIHPNNSGHARLAENLAPQLTTAGIHLRNTFEENS